MEVCWMPSVVKKNIKFLAFLTFVNRSFKILWVNEFDVNVIKVCNIKFETKPLEQKVCTSLGIIYCVIQINFRMIDQSQNNIKGELGD